MLSPAQIREAFQTLKGIHVTLIDIRDELILTRKNRECVAISERKAADVAALRAAGSAARDIAEEASFTQRARKGRRSDEQTEVHNPERRNRRRCGLVLTHEHTEHYWDAPRSNGTITAYDRSFCDGELNPPAKRLGLP